MLTFATWNIHGCIGGDRVCDPERVAAVIREIDPDVLGLQEVGAHARVTSTMDQFDYFLKSTGLCGVPGPTLQRKAGSYGNALFVRGEALAVRNLELTVGRHEPRGVIDVDAVVRGTRVRVVNTHLGRRSGERLGQVQRMLDGLGLPGPGLMVVMGDFNEWVPLARSLRRLRERFGPGIALRTFSARTPVFRLDRIWVVPASALLEVRTHRSALARVASDHLPVVARVVGSGGGRGIA